MKAETEPSRPRPQKTARPETGVGAVATAKMIGAVTGPVDRGNDRGGDNRVVGMGDHLPSFIELSFEERSVSYDPGHQTRICGSNQTLLATRISPGG